MKTDATTKKTAKSDLDSFDWSHFDAMTDEERHAAALSDPDAQPLTEEQLARMKPFSPAKRLRMGLHLTQEEFARRYGIPLSTLRDWEQYRTEPDQAAQSYIQAIEACPDAIAEALASAATGASIGRGRPAPTFAVGFRRVFPTGCGPLTRISHKIAR